MNSDKVAELRKLFPFIDVKCKLNFGNGWFKLIAGFCGAAKIYADDSFRITEMDSREGKLNIMYHSDRNNSTLDNLVARAEIRSTHICEHCGYEFPANYTLGTRMHQIRNRQVRLCPGCVDRYMILCLRGNETAFKI